MRLLAILLLALTAFEPLASARAAEADSVVARRYVAAIAEGLPPEAHAALLRIDGTPRRLLAARGYLRAADTLAVRWSWSADAIEAYEASAEHQELLAEIARVQARFEADNPGYSLYTNTQTRSLDLQLRRWNENASVAAIGAELQRAAIKELRAGGYPRDANAAGTLRFAEFLRGWRPSRAIPLSTPGLSLHGQSRAVDFQIVKGDQLVAGTEIADVTRVWERHGWTRKLERAVADSDFVGPLQSPNEPWHYEYTPSRGGAVSRTRL